MVLHFVVVPRLWTFILSMALAAPATKLEIHGDKRYMILDNDWSTTSFIPFLMALDAGMEVLDLTTCK